MKVLFFIFIFFSISIFKIRGQANLVKFMEQLSQQSAKLEKKKESDMKKFMKIGYKQDPYLRNDSIIKTPIYAIFVHSMFLYQNRIKDSLFVYLNPKSMTIDNVIFSKDDHFIGKAYQKYSNKRIQPIFHESDRGEKLNKIIVKDKPDILFSLMHSISIYFMVKDNLLSCYVYDKEKEDYISMKPDEFIKMIDDSNHNFNFMTNQDRPERLIYTK